MATLQTLFWLKETRAGPPIICRWWGGAIMATRVVNGVRFSVYRTVTTDVWRALSSVSPVTFRKLGSSEMLKTCWALAL